QIVGRGPGSAPRDRAVGHAAASTLRERHAHERRAGRAGLGARPLRGRRLGSGRHPLRAPRAAHRHPDARAALPRPLRHLAADDAADALAALASDLRAGLDAVERSIWGAEVAAQNARARPREVAPAVQRDPEHGGPLRRWWRRRASWTAAAMVLPPMAVIGFP